MMDRRVANKSESQDAIKVGELAECTPKNTDDHTLGIVEDIYERDGTTYVKVKGIEFTKTRCCWIPSEEQYAALLDKFKAEGGGGANYTSNGGIDGPAIPEIRFFKERWSP